MNDRKVVPLRAAHARKEARLKGMRKRFERVYPEGTPRRTRPRMAKPLVIALLAAALMIWIASALAA